MSIRKAAPLALAVAVALAGCTAIPGGAARHTLQVTGQGSVRLLPDVVVVTLGVQTRGPDVAEAVGENNMRAQAVIEALTEAGVAAEDIQTAYFNVYGQPQYDERGNPTGEVTYWVDNTLRLSVRQIDQLGVLLQRALVRGANNVQSVTYSVEDPTAALDEARQMAIADAREQAGQLAAAGGVQIVRVLAIGEPGTYPVPVFDAPSVGKGGGGAVPTAPGALEYQVQVSVTYEIR